MRVLLTVSLFILTLFVGCSKEDEPKPISPTSPASPTIPTKTILVYMAGENSLSKYTQINLTSIITGARQSNIEECNLLIYSDARGSLPKLYKIEKNKQGIVDSVLVKTYEEQNSADMQTMREIITDVFTEYPAQEKGLFLWSHGTAWLPSNINDYKGLRSFGQDGTNHMEITELREALPDNVSDYIIFDACYMSSIEVAYELRHKTKYILGSSAEVMAEGFPYTITIPALLANGELEERLKNAAESFYNHYNAQSNEYQTGNVSLIRTAELATFAASCKPIFAGRYTEERMIDPSGYGLNLQALEYLTSPIAYSFLYDFQSYMKALSAHVDMENVIIYKNTTPYCFFAQPYKSMPINTYSGLSIYVPQTRNPKLNEWYKQLDWYKAVYE